MPELPEVETTVRGIRPHILGGKVSRVIVRNRQLRWPVPAGLERRLRDCVIEKVYRRGKYILLQTGNGTLLMHLGMSGSLRIVPADSAVEKHDHVDLVLAADTCLRLRDPRRFGAVLWAGKEPLQHKLLVSLGPEPLSADFHAEYLYQLARGRKQAIKSFIMDGHIVVGVGNIYASEALFRSGIHPQRAAGRIAFARFEKLVASIREVLQQAIEKGGTSLRDFVNGDGSPGYFYQRLQVYDRLDQPCSVCKKSIRQVTIGQRSSFYCPGCQR